MKASPWPARLVRAAVWATAAFVAVSVVAAVVPDTAMAAAVVVDLVLFAAGCALFLVTLVRAAARSREAELTVAGIWFLSGTAPFPTRLRLLGALTAEVAVALATAGARPFTGLAFGVLVPTFGLGTTGLWAVLAGTFPPRAVPVPHRPTGRRVDRP